MNNEKNINTKIYSLNKNSCPDNDNDSLLSSDNSIISDDESILSSDGDDFSSDEEWLEEFNKNKEKYNSFNKTIPSAVKTYYIYISNNKIVSLKEETLLLSNGVLDKYLINSIIKDREINETNETNKTNETNETNEYIFKVLLRFNIDIDKEYIGDLFTEKHTKYNFFSVVKDKDSPLTNISFNKTITMFQDINTLFFIFEEKINDKMKKNNFNKLIDNKTRRKKNKKQTNHKKPQMTRVKRT